MPRYGGLLLDLYGTLIPRPNNMRHEEFMELLSDVSGKDLNSVKEKWSSTYERRITGADPSVNDYLTYFFNTLGADICDKDLALIGDEYEKLTKELMMFFEDVEPTLQQVRKRGMKIGLLTNCNSFVPSFFKDSTLIPYFDVLVFSSIEGKKKPDPSLFKTACERLSVTESECVFVGDGDSKELIVATELGMKSIRIERGEISGDHLIDPCNGWEPTITTFQDLFEFL